MIRPAESRDAAGIGALAVSAGLFSLEDHDIVDSLLTDYFAGAAHEHRCLVDDAAGTVRSVAYFQPKPAGDRLWDLTMIAVDPTLRRGGLGKALMASVEEELRESGQRLLVVETSSTEPCEAARRFYATLGYEKHASVPDYWEDGDGMVLFTKHL